MFGLCFVPVQNKVNPNLLGVENSDLVQVFVILWCCNCDRCTGCCVLQVVACVGIVGVDEILISLYKQGVVEACLIV